MKILYNEDLKKYTTFRMGGLCEKMWIPESVDELIGVLTTLPKPHYIIGGGSNLLINDLGRYSDVICLKEFNKEIVNKGNGRYKVGGSVRLQKLITEINNNCYGGIEYLFSVPGLVGGAVYMNAGRGKNKNQTISDYITKVITYCDGEIKERDVDYCNFSHRYSAFQDREEIIISVEFKFDEFPKEELDKRRQERIELCKAKQDNSGPNFGTVFCIADGRIMKLFSKTSNMKSGVYYSKKRPNWMINNNGSFLESKKLINRVIKVHKFFHKECKKEVIIWE